MSKNVSASRGFSLVELVVTMGILAIIASIAIPSYNSYVLKSHRTEAKTALLDMASMEERFFSTQNVYSTTATDLGYTTFPVTIGNGNVNGDYQIAAPNVTAAVAPTAAVPAGTPASFTITATAVNTQANDSTCTTFTISSTGAQTATPAANAATCWN